MKDKNITDYGRNVSFNKAFKSAQGNKSRLFIWNGKRYNTDLDNKLPVKTQQTTTSSSFVHPNIFAKRNQQTGTIDQINKGIVSKVETGIQSSEQKQKQAFDLANKSQGTLREISKKEFKKGASAIDIVTNPMTALKYKMQGRDIPENFTKGDRNVLDYAGDIINPMTYINAGGRTAKRVLNPIETIKTLGKATTNVAGQLIDGKNVFNDGSNEEAFAAIGDAGMMLQGFKSAKNLGTLSRDMKFNNSISTRDGKVFNNSKDFLDWHKTTQNSRPLLKKELNFLNKEIKQRGILEGQRSNPLNPLPKLTRRMLVPEDYNLNKVAKDAIPNLIKSIKNGNVYDQYTMGPGRLNAFNQWLGLPTEGSMYRVNQGSFKNGKNLLYTTTEDATKGVFDKRLASKVPASQETYPLDKGAFTELEATHQYYNSPGKIGDRNSTAMDRVGQFADVSGEKDFKSYMDLRGLSGRKGSNVIGGIDDFTGSGGGVSWKKTPLSGGGVEWTMRDVWDINPFSRIKGISGQDGVNKFVKGIDVAPIIGAKNFDVNWNFKTSAKMNKITDMNGYKYGGNVKKYPDRGQPKPIGLWNTNKVGWVDSVNNANMAKNFVQRQYLKNGPTISTPKNIKGWKPGMSSTHLMAYDPKSQDSYPEVVQSADGKMSYKPGDKGWDYAHNNNEFIHFPTAEQAQYYSSNGYKKGTGVQVGKYAVGGSVPNPNDFNTDQDYQNAMYRHQLDNLTLSGQNNFIPSPKFPVFQQNGMFDDGTQFQSLRPENEMLERNRLSNANPELITSQSLRQASPTIDPNRAPTNLIPPNKKNALGEIGDFLKDYKSQAITLGLGFLGNVTDRDKNDRKQIMINGSSDSLYSTNTGSRGDWSVNEGKLKADQNVFSQFSANPLNEYGIPRAALGMVMDNSLTSSVNYSAGLMPGTTQSAIPEFNMPSSGVQIGQQEVLQYSNKNADVSFTPKMSKGKERTKFAYDYYTQQKGVAPHIAAGIVGNLYQESGLKPGAVEKTNTANGRGIAQWDVRDRWQGLLSWAQTNQRDPYDLKSQLDYVLIEPHESNKVFQKLQKAKSPEEAAKIFGKTYERPSERFAAWSTRQNVAKKLHDGTYSEGGEYEMNPDELNNFLKNGGQVEYL